MKNRSYDQFCALAYALDVVGDRWTLLVIRELMIGPRRFTDLIDGLPGISTNLLSERLKGLMLHGLLTRRDLPPPAGSTVYELTPLGVGLEPALLELGRWGSQFLPPSLDGVSLPSTGAMALAIKAFFHLEDSQGVDESYELHLGKEILQVQVKNGEMDVRQGQAAQAATVIHTSMDCFVGLFAGQIQPDRAVAEGLVKIEGDPGALNRFLKFSGVS